MRVFVPVKSKKIKCRYRFAYDIGTLFFDAAAFPAIFHGNALCRFFLYRLNGHIIYIFIKMPGYYT